MPTINTFRKIALSFPETAETSHFDKSAFKVAKKIFATLDLNNNIGALKLSLKDQDLFILFERKAIYPVPNKWGKQGWTNVNLSAVREDMLTDALKAAYCFVAPKKLGELVIINKI